MHRLDPEHFIGGHDYEAGDYVVVHDYDTGQFNVLAARDLIGYQHSGERGFMQHVATAASLAVPVGETAGAAAFVLQRALPVFFALVDENRRNIVKWWPNAGAQILFCVDIAQTLFAAYGIGQLAHSGAGLFRQWRAARAALALEEGVEMSDDARRVLLQLEQQSDTILAKRKARRLRRRLRPRKLPTSRTSTRPSPSTPARRLVCRPRPSMTRARWRATASSTVQPARPGVGDCRRRSDKRRSAAGRCAPVTIVESGGAMPAGTEYQSATARTARSQITSIRADIAESQAYNVALRRGEIGLLRPEGANVPGVDFITARQIGNTGAYEILITDVKASTICEFPSPKTTIRADWIAEARASVDRLALGDATLRKRSAMRSKTNGSIRARLRWTTPPRAEVASCSSTDTP